MEISMSRNNRIKISELKNKISKKIFVVLLLGFSACSHQEIKNSPELPKLDQPSFSYEEALGKEKLLLERAKTVQFVSVINSK